MNLNNCKMMFYKANDKNNQLQLLSREDFCKKYKLNESGGQLFFEKIKNDLIKDIEKGSWHHIKNKNFDGGAIVLLIKDFNNLIKQYILSINFPKTELEKISRYDKSESVEYNIIDLKKFNGGNFIISIGGKLNAGEIPESPMCKTMLGYKFDFENRWSVKEDKIVKFDNLYDYKKDSKFKKMVYLLKDQIIKKEDSIDEVKFYFRIYSKETRILLNIKSLKDVLDEIGTEDILNNIKENDNSKNLNGLNSSKNFEIKDTKHVRALMKILDFKTKDDINNFFNDLHECYDESDAKKFENSWKQLFKKAEEETLNFPNSDIDAVCKKYGSNNLDNFKSLLDNMIDDEEHPNEVHTMLLLINSALWRAKNLY